MGPKKRRKARAKQPVQTAAAVAKERDQDTARLINEALERGIDVARLRQLAAVRGLVSTDLRARLWPILLNGADGHVGGPSRSASNSPVPGRHPSEGTASNALNSTAVELPGARKQLCTDYEQWSSGTHKDKSTVRVDVERSLYSFAGFLNDDERSLRRQQLERLLNAVVVRHDGNVHYYQGLHDVASVLLLVADEAAAFDMLCHLATGHLRDATRSSLDPVIELLGLMGPIVAAADEELANHLSAQGLPPFYALSWFITWFSHDLADFGEVCRLFDLFLATHPLMPLYVGAAAMHTQRQQLLAAEEMPVLHSKLVNLSVTKMATADQLAIQAIKLYKRATPESIISSRQLLLQQCITPRVELSGGVWHYPEPQTVGPGLWSQRRLQMFVQQLTRLPLPGTPAQRKRLVLASLSGVLGSLYVVGLCVMMAKHPNMSPFSMLSKL